MEPRAWSDLISSAVVPVVMISACGLLCLAFYNRLSVVVTRLRSLQRERFAEYRELFRLDEEKKKRVARQESEHFLHFLEEQTVDVLKRARYLRNCIFCLISSIFSFALTSLVIGFSFFYTIVEIFVIFFFVLGLLLLLYGLTFAILEIKIALNPIKMESGFVQQLIKSKLQESTE